MLGLFRLLPWGFMFIGGVWIVGGLATLVRHVETEPTPVSIASLEQGQFPDAEWLEISDGRLFWAATVVRYKTRETLKDGRSEEKVTKRLGYYVPLVSAPLAGRWVEQARAHGSLSYDRCRVIVYISQQLLERGFPDVARGKPNHLTDVLVANGLTEIASDLDDVAVAGLAEHTPGLNLDGAVVLRQGEKPMQKAMAGTITLMGLFLAGPSFLWVRWRSKRRATRAAAVASAEVLPPGHHSVRDLEHGVPPSDPAASDAVAPDERLSIHR